MPTGSSKGANSSRAATSHSSTKPPPSRAAEGSSQRLSPPTSRRAIWGTSSPTNPRRPEKLTAAPASRAAASTARNRVRPTWRPRPAALSSPSRRTSRSAAKKAASAAPAARYQPADWTEVSVTPLNPPSIKAAAPTAVSGYSSVRALLPAVIMLLTAMPARISVVRDSPAFAARA